MNITIRIAGEAGQGVQTTGGLLVKAFANLGLHVLATQSYMSRVRGGVNWYDIRISENELFSGSETAHLLVTFSDKALDILRHHMASEGIILSDGLGAGENDIIQIPFSKTAKEATGSALMANTVAAGAIFAVLGYQVEKLQEYLASQFRKKGTEVIEKNNVCVQLGENLAAPYGKTVSSPKPGDKPSPVYSGSEVIGMSAARAGVKFVSSYPMTPSTGVFTYMASKADTFGMVVEQAEDEIAAVNMICGAVYAGVPSMTTTSGGGFALMCEGLSLAGMMELPIFILLAQRPAPATGMPTRTGQEDLKFAVNAGHGEFPRAVFAPGSLAQAYSLTRTALETAHEFQTPAIFLVDQFLTDLQKTTEHLEDSLLPINLHIEENPKKDYVRYALHSSGISPRAVPGSGVFILCDSDEHAENGHMTENPVIRLQQHDKRMSKLAGMRKAAVLPEYHGPDNPKVLVIAWGSTYGPARGAVDALISREIPVGLLHFSQVWPLNPQHIHDVLDGVSCSLEDGVDVVCVEGNSTGQFAAILREQGIIRDCRLVLRYDGMPFTEEELIARLGYV